MRITFSSNTYILLAILLLAVPLPLLTAWLSAVVFHEVCHWLAVKLLGGEIYSVSIGVGGANMQCDCLSDWRRLIAVLSGPLGGFLLVLLGRWLPRVALCSWMLSAYNLLPIYPLDGGRAMEILIGNPSVFLLVQKLVVLMLILATVYAAFVLGFGVLPLLVTGGLLIKRRKFPCNADAGRVQ